LDFTEAFYSCIIFYGLLELQYQLNTHFSKALSLFNNIPVNLHHNYQNWLERRLQLRLQCGKLQ